MKDSKQDIKARGERLKRIRQLTGLERKEFSEQYAFNPQTYQDWEIAKRNSIPKSKALLLIEKLKQDGYIVTLEWLIDGHGMLPYYVTDECIHKMLKSQTALPAYIQEENQINNELGLFLLGHNDSISLIIPDEAMQPFYKQGDIVAGIKCDDHDRDKYLGQDCIVQLQNDQLLLRRLAKGRDSNTYTLIAINPNVIDKNLYDIELKNIAPVLWLRRKNYFIK